jgi:hypothetical protein
MTYHTFQQHFAKSFAERVKGKPLFTTNTEGLFTAYLDGIPPADRQEYNCHCCKAFIEKYGGLVYHDDNGQVQSAMWKDIGAFSQSFKAMRKQVSKIITGVFYSNTFQWGVKSTPPHLHMYVDNPSIYRERLMLPHEKTALSKELYKSVSLALAEYSLDTLEKAVTLLESETLYRSEKVLGQAKFLLDLRKSRKVWNAIATAPEGFLHPRSSMIATLLEDIEGKHPAYAERFAEKMHPLRYQRPTAAPSDGALLEAEKAFAALGLSESLKRRYARLEDVPCIWKPFVQPESSSLFGHLKAKPEALELTSKTMTWVKFLRDVLPKAKSIKAYVRDKTSFSSFVTATDMSAPPILQWDEVENRNPLSWYFYSGGSSASSYSLTKPWVEVTGIAESPKFPSQEDKIMFLLEGARDTRNPSLCLFPEILKGFLHPYKRVIEANNATRTISHKEESTAAGLFLSKSDTWNLKVCVSQGGVEAEYTIDRWE